MVSGHDLALALRVAYLTMHRRTDAVMAAQGITADQFVVLAALAEHGKQTQQELSDRTTSDRNTLRSMLLLLEKQGLIVRSDHPSDRRARFVAMTRKGKGVFQRLWKKSESLRQDLLSGMSKKDVETFFQLLQSFALSAQGDASDSTRDAVLAS